MAQTYHQLRYDERCQIQALHRQGASAHTIAAQLQRHRSTIHRELRRNADSSGYCHRTVQVRSEERRRQAASGPRKLHPPVWDRICDMLQMHWSPEQIAGRLRLAGDVSVSFSWLYRRIHQDRADGGQLHACLRQRGKPRRCKAAKGSAGCGCIPGRTDISERPSIVDDKRRTGDWEGDTIIGKAYSGAVVTLVDRRSKYTLTQRVTNKTAALVGGAVQDLLAPFTFYVERVPERGQAKQAVGSPSRRSQRGPTHSATGNRFLPPPPQQWGEGARAAAGWTVCTLDLGVREGSGSARRSSSCVP